MCWVHGGRVADDGKHASSVIEVGTRPRGQEERGFGGEGSSVGNRGRGFKANG